MSSGVKTALVRNYPTVSSDSEALLQHWDSVTELRLHSSNKSQQETPAVVVAFELQNALLSGTCGGSGHAGTATCLPRQMASCTYTTSNSTTRQSTAQASLVLGSTCDVVPTGCPWEPVSTQPHGE